ncbi:hypothetical protein IWQ61_002448 [Dispira simplex]|nr:hypothetical protein IWQ61_002448 [Dispira simplex]
MIPSKRRGRPPKTPQGKGITPSPSSIRTSLRLRSSVSLSPSPSPTTRLSRTRKGEPLTPVTLRQTTLFSTRPQRTPKRSKPSLIVKSSPEISSESDQSDAFVPSNESEKSSDDDDDVECAEDEGESKIEEGSDSETVAKSKKTPKPASQITLEEYLASGCRGRPPKHLTSAYKALSPDIKMATRKSLAAQKAWEVQTTRGSPVTPRTPRKFATARNSYGPKISELLPFNPTNHPWLDSSQGLPNFETPIHPANSTSDGGEESVATITPDPYHSLTVDPSQYQLVPYHQAEVVLYHPSFHRRVYLSPTEAVNLPPLASHPLSSAQGYVLNTGVPLWGLDWRCDYQSDGSIEYLATGGFSRENHPLRSTAIGVRQPTNPGAILIWKMSTRTLGNSNSKLDSKPRVILTLLHEYGNVMDLQWAPVYFPKDGQSEFKHGEGRNTSIVNHLGVLAATFGDGRLVVFLVPHPTLLTKLKDGSNKEESSDQHLNPYFRTGEVPPPTCLVRLPILLSCQHPNKLYHTLHWGNATTLAVGASDGTISVWDLRPAIRQWSPSRSPVGREKVVEECTPSPPLFQVKVHDSLVRQVALRPHRTLLLSTLSTGPHELPTDILSCGDDGHVMLTRVEDPEFPVNVASQRRTTHSISWSGCGGSFLCSVPYNNVRAVKYHELGLSNRLFSCRSTVWDTATSFHHPFVATACSNGTIVISNINSAIRTGNKGCRLYERHAYTTHWDYQKDFYVFEDQHPPVQGLTSNNAQDIHHHISAPPVAAHRVKFNPNFQSCTWLASGGAHGLVRVEDTQTR